MPFLPPSSARTVHVLGDRIAIRLAAADSPSQMTLVTVDVPPGGFIPLCSHRTEEELYLVLAGELHVRLGAEERALRPGDAVHVPPGTPHAYRNAGPDTARFAAVGVGGPLDRFFVEMAEQVHEMPRDRDALARVMARYGVHPASA